MQEKNVLPTVQTAMVSNIQRCSVHDGPGIRTTIFLKGCNMCEQGCFSGARVLCGKEMSVQEFRQLVVDRFIGTI